MNVMNNKKQGSALLGVVIAIVIISALVGSRVRLVVQERRSVERMVLFDMALDVAESGAEDGVLAMNQNDFSEWKKLPSGDWLKTVDGLDSGSGRVGSYQILLTDIDSRTATLYIEGTVSSPMIGDVRRQIMVDLETRSIFGNGLIAQESVDFKKRTEIEIRGYDSSKGRGVYDDFHNHNDMVHVAAESAEKNAVSLGDADINGHVATSGRAPKYSGNARIWGNDTDFDVSVDSERIYNDYYADFITVDSPVLDSALSTLPAVSDSGDMILGKLARNEYVVDNLNIAEGQSLLVTGEVTIVVNDTAEIEGDIDFSSDGSLKLYVQNDLTISGGVNMDDAVASDFQIYGTSAVPEDGSEFHFNHVGVLKAAVLAPNSLVTFERGNVADDKIKGNNGHGNNLDGVDSSNSGNSKDGLDSDPNVDDERA